jgi:hypothetical protein
MADPLAEPARIPRTLSHWRSRRVGGVIGIGALQASDVPVVFRGDEHEFFSRSGRVQKTAAFSGRKKAGTRCGEPAFFPREEESV